MLSEQIAALPTLNRAQLLAIWAENFSNAPPPNLREELMVPILAYRMQEREFPWIGSNSGNFGGLEWGIGVIFLGGMIFVFLRGVLGKTRVWMWFFDGEFVVDRG